MVDLQFISIISTMNQGVYSHLNLEFNFFMSPDRLERDWREISDGNKPSLENTLKVVADFLFPKNKPKRRLPTSNIRKSSAFSLLGSPHILAKLAHRRQPPLSLHSPFDHPSVHHLLRKSILLCCSRTEPSGRSVSSQIQLHRLHDLLFPSFLSSSSSSHTGGRCWIANTGHSYVNRLNQLNRGRESDPLILFVTEVLVQIYMIISKLHFRFWIADLQYNQIENKVGHWISACTRSVTKTDDALVNSLRKLILGGEDYGSIPSLNIDVCSERQVQLVFEMVKSQYENVKIEIFLRKNLKIVKRNKANVFVAFESRPTIRKTWILQQMLLLQVIGDHVREEINDEFWVEREEVEAKNKKLPRFITGS
ncbi:hypothetical protein LXL04_027169 [Taraxacum kok-saghyz]